jgi:electron transport complex protein RnfA
MELVSLSIGAILVSNVILSQFLGICPFLGVSKKTSSAIGMGAAMTFVVLCSSMLSFALYNLVLVPFGLEYLKLAVFILVIATFVQLVEFFTKKYMPSLYKALGVYLPLITTNCVVLNVALAVTGNDYNFIQTIVYAISISLGYTLVITLFSAIRVRLDSNEALPAPFKGNPIALITAALMALAFLGFAGILQ